MSSVCVWAQNFRLRAVGVHGVGICHCRCHCVVVIVIVTVIVIVIVIVVVVVVVVVVVICSSKCVGRHQFAHIDCLCAVCVLPFFVVFDAARCTSASCPPIWNRVRCAYVHMCECLYIYMWVVPVVCVPRTVVMNCVQVRDGE